MSLTFFSLKAITKNLETLSYIKQKWIGHRENGFFCLATGEECQSVDVYYPVNAR